MACERDEAALAHVCPVFRASVPAAHAARGSTHRDAYHAQYGAGSARAIAAGGGAAFRNAGLRRMLRYLAALCGTALGVRVAIMGAGVPTAIARIMSPTW